MEDAGNAELSGFERYGTRRKKTLYVYGDLDPGPTVIERGFGYTWSYSGFLLRDHLESVSPERLQRLRSRLVDQAMSTFASAYAGTLTLTDMLDEDVVGSFARKATGQKYLVRPNAGAMAGA